MFYSPLRYPGGKNKLSAFLAKICIDNNINGHYVEPYCGGASVAFFLLFEEYVNHITINDKDRSIYAFWYSVLNHTDELCNLITNTDINIKNWELQKEVQNNKDKATLINLGFSTLFLNRTNRSGILKGGVIGGKEQLGNYKLNCRFNKTEIIRRIRIIASRRDQITLYSLDAIDLIDLIEKQSKEKNMIIYFDPPYYLKAESLYMNYYKGYDHKDVSDRIKAIININWIVSYDNHEVIKGLYFPFKSKEYTFNHSAHTSRVGKEILFFSNQLNQPQLPTWNPIEFKIKKLANSKKIIHVPLRIKASETDNRKDLC